MNSKKIGGSYEREIARLLSKWISGKDDPLICWRTAGSGSVATNDKKRGLSGITQDGDFQCLNSKYEHIFNLFFIDSKCYKECNPYFINEKNKKSNSILNQWKKVCGEAKNGTKNKIPLMIVKIRDRKTPEFVLLPSYVRYSNLILCNYMIYSFVDPTIQDCTFILLDDFIKNIQAEELFFLNKNKY
jgi:hypothetical protein